MVYVYVMVRSFGILWHINDSFQACNLALPLSSKPINVHSSNTVSSTVFVSYKVADWKSYMSSAFSSVFGFHQLLREISDFICS